MELGARVSLISVPCGAELVHRTGIPEFENSIVAT